MGRNKPTPLRAWRTYFSELTAVGSETLENQSLMKIFYGGVKDLSLLSRVCVLKNFFHAHTDSSIESFWKENSAYTVYESFST